MTELSACHRQHHPIEQKVIHYYSQHEDTGGTDAGGRMDRVGRGEGVCLEAGDRVTKDE